MNTHINTKLRSLSSDFKDIKSVVKDVMKNVCDLTKGVEEMGRAVGFVCSDYNSIRNKLNQQHQKLNRTKRETDQSLIILKERLIGIEERSNRDNLIFFGLSENSGEDLELAMHNFIKTKLTAYRKTYHLSSTCTPNWSMKKKQPDLDPLLLSGAPLRTESLIRRSAPDLSGTQFSIQEQYPVEIQKRRQLLQPKLRDAKDQGVKASPRRDIPTFQDPHYSVSNEGEIYTIEEKNNTTAKGEQRQRALNKGGA